MNGHRVSSILLFVDFNRGERDALLLLQQGVWSHLGDEVN